MSKLCSMQLNNSSGVKEISVFCDDITRFGETIDVLTTSAFVRSYFPTPRTVFQALWQCGIHVDQLAHEPELDLRKLCHVWLSGEIKKSSADIKRIGCIELIGSHTFTQDRFEQEQSMIHSIRSYFYMLDIASVYCIPVGTVALPLLGSGRQGVSGEFLLVPLINECIAFLKRNPCAQNIYFIEKNPEKAAFIAQSLNQSLRFANSDTPITPIQPKKPLAFISYSSKDKNIADNLCSKLENKGIRVWYAPRDVKGAYAESIVNAINNACYFIVILSENSIASQHVLNEIDLAFQCLPENIKFKPLKLDNTLLTPSFQYYLSRQHWLDATDPPLERHLNAFVNDILNDA